jgi:hypothetical protein
MSQQVPQKKASRQDRNLLKFLDYEESSQAKESFVHIIRENIICKTDTRGFSTPQGKSMSEIVVDSSEGFIPLWEKNTTLRWRFQEQSFLNLENASTVKSEIKYLLGEAILAWGDAAPVKFAQSQDVWDFEIVMQKLDECENGGCVLASSFFPDAGRHELAIYPRMFSQVKEEQIETLAHEIGHIFGLRHFFANLRETQWASEIFGRHEPFSIMNYGEKSKLTKTDQEDLKQLYNLVWTGALKDINGTRIHLVSPFHSSVHSERIVTVSNVTRSY